MKFKIGWTRTSKKKIEWYVVTDATEPPWYSYLHKDLEIRQGTFKGEEPLGWFESEEEAQLAIGKYQTKGK